jgi:hypothetical protein
VQEALASAAEQMKAFKDQLESSHKEWCEQVMSKRDTEKERPSQTYTHVSFSSCALFIHSILASLLCTTSLAASWVFTMRPAGRSFGAGA